MRDCLAKWKHELKELRIRGHTMVVIVYIYCPIVKVRNGRDPMTLVNVLNKKNIINIHPCLSIFMSLPHDGCHDIFIPLYTFASLFIVRIKFPLDPPTEHCIHECCPYFESFWPFIKTLPVQYD